MKRIIDLITESKQINECGGSPRGGSDVRYGCGGGAPEFNPRSTKPSKPSKEDIIFNLRSNFAYNVVDMLKNIKGTTKDRAKKRIEKAWDHLYEKSKSMNGGEFIKAFAEYLENF